MTNAVKFTPAGGRILVTADKAGDQLRIEVADTGMGIDPAFVPHVFDRFRQEESGTTRTFGGLGLGLAIEQYDVLVRGYVLLPLPGSTSRVPLRETRAFF